MGLFSRRRDDASTDSDESILASDAGADVDDLNESAASGPWDLSELPEDQEDVPRIDLGALQVPAVDGMQLRLEQGPDGTITAVVLALGGSALELRNDVNAQLLTGQVRPGKLKALGGLVLVLLDRGGRLVLLPRGQLFDGIGLGLVIILARGVVVGRHGLVTLSVDGSRVTFTRRELSRARAPASCR